jgi:type I restriction enzyme R subunit
MTRQRGRSTGFSEDELVERPAIELFGKLGWETADGFHEFDSGASLLNRETKGDVVLLSRLKHALERLNPSLSEEAIDQAVEELTRDRSAMSLPQANREVYRLLRDGVRVKIRDPEAGGETDETVHVIDWRNPAGNDFFLASQFWVTGELHTRRADLVGFVNGLPLVFVELKASHRRLEDAFNRNLRDYKDTIPRIFWYNQMIILSNGSESAVGSVTAGWEHFADWKRISSEGEQGVVSLETMIRGTCDQERLLDLVENFTLFQEVRGGLIKVLAKNHQYLGVNNAIEAVRAIKKNQGRLGVFWHTQGSGKSVSMIFFSQKILRTMPGNWTFVVVTDRQELDDQIYKEFTRSGVVTETKAQAESSAHLRQLLQEDHRLVFTLIHKFRTERGEKHPVLSKRSDIIVIADEAHRTQYDSLAMNMRMALPEAAFIAFTGTPLMAGEEKTRKVFGDYVSIYNFRQSVEDKATVPLFYENRIPELQVTNQGLNEDIYGVIEDAELDADQEQKLEREFAREYHLITRDDRLERIAKDIVEHFLGRGFQGKAMVVCIDKATAVRMYDKVRKHWKEKRDELQKQLQKAAKEKKEALEGQIRFMDGTDMAVVVSQAQNEIDDLRKKGLDIRPHRKRMLTEDLDSKFKDPNDPFRLVFVCAMWMTGFDVPSCSTIYLDKPMRNHTLMQTIARANRVFPDKSNGLIVDYVGVFRNLQKALAIYGSGTGGGAKEGEMPVHQKEALLAQLAEALAEAHTFCTARGIDLDAIQAAAGFDRVRLMDDAVDAVLVNEETKQKFLAIAGGVTKLHKAVMPDPKASEVAPVCAVLAVLAEKIRSRFPPADISAVMAEVEAVLDRSIATEGYVIRDNEAKERIVDLSKIDFKALRKAFETGRKHTEVEKLKWLVGRKIQVMVRLNRSRLDYLQKFRQLVEDYNSGAINLQVFFDRLVQFSRELSGEEQRAIKEHLSEEELAIFDLLTKPDLRLSKKQHDEVKKVARELLKTLKDHKLVLDWRKRQQSRAAVRLAIEKTLDELPEDKYPEAVFHQKCESVFNHVFESYVDESHNVYSKSA